MAKPKVARATKPAARALLVCCIFACTRAEPTSEAPSPLGSDRPPAVRAPAALTPVGWWKSDALCFELFANGDFQLSIHGRAPKVQILGEATVNRSRGNDHDFTFAVKRIWKARFTGPCRKVHETGRWAPSQDALGVAFDVDKRIDVKLTRLDEDHIELCAKTCVKLKRETPVLSGRWRIKGLENPTAPKIVIEPGNVLELSLAENAHVWIGAAGGTYDVRQGTAKARFVSYDRFAIEMTAGGQTLALTAKRSNGERLEVCAGTQCTWLDREFDAFSHGL
jgi:hypothetical protein